jgi:hypothetical protein
VAASAEGVAAFEPVFSVRPEVCAVRLTTKIAEKTRNAGALHVIHRWYFDDNDFLAVGDCMAALPPICLASRAQAIYSTSGAL